MNLHGVCFLISESMLAIILCCFNGLLLVGIGATKTKNAAVMFTIMIFLALNALIYIPEHHDNNFLLKARQGTTTKARTGVVIVELLAVIPGLYCFHRIYLYAVHFPSTADATARHAPIWMKVYQVIEGLMVALCISTHLATLSTGDRRWIYLFCALLAAEIMILSAFFQILQNKAGQILIGFGGNGEWQSLTHISWPKSFRKWAQFMAVVSIFEFAFTLQFVVEKYWWPFKQPFDVEHCAAINVSSIMIAMSVVLILWIRNGAGNIQSNAQFKPGSGWQQRRKYILSKSNEDTSINTQ